MDSSKPDQAAEDSQKAVIELRVRERDRPLQSSHGQETESLPESTNSTRKPQRLLVPLAEAKKQIKLRRRVKLRRRSRRQRRERLRLVLEAGTSSDAQQNTASEVGSESHQEAEGIRAGELMPEQTEQLSRAELAAEENTLLEASAASELDGQEVNRPRHRHEGQLLLFAITLLFLGVLQFCWKLMFPLPEETSDEFAATALWDKEVFILPSSLQNQQGWVKLDEYLGKPIYAEQSQRPQLQRANKAFLEGTTRSGRNVYRAGWLEDGETPQSQGGNEEQLALMIEPKNEQGEARFLMISFEAGESVEARNEE